MVHAGRPRYAECAEEAKGESIGGSTTMIRVLLISEFEPVRDALSILFDHQADMQLIGNVGTPGEVNPLVSLADVAVAAFPTRKRRRGAQAQLPIPLPVAGRVTLQSIVSAVRIVANGGLLILYPDSRLQVVVMAIRHKRPKAR
jgi:hypothetical protein